MDCLLSVVVVAASHVLVLERRVAHRRGGRRLLIEPSLQNPLDVFSPGTARDPYAERSFASGVHARRSVLLRGAQQAEARAVALLGVDVSTQREVDDCSNRRTKFRRPPDEALGWPSLIPMVLGPVRRVGNSCP